MLEKISNLLSSLLWFLLVWFGTFLLVLVSLFFIGIVIGSIFQSSFYDTGRDLIFGLAIVTSFIVALTQAKESEKFWGAVFKKISK